MDRETDPAPVLSDEDRTVDLTDRDLTAYLEDRAIPALKRLIDARLPDEEDLQRRLAALDPLVGQLQAAFDPVAAGAPRDRLEERLAEAGGQGRTSRKTAQTDESDPSSEGRQSH